MSNYKTVFFTLGILLIILGVAMIVPVVFQLIYDEFDPTFIISGIITITFGILFFLSNIDHLKSINTQQTNNQHTYIQKYRYLYRATSAVSDTQLRPHETREEGG